MNRQEFLLGACLYGLIVAAGFSKPILKKLECLPWDRPIGSFSWSALQTFIPPAFLLGGKVKRTLIPLPVKGSVVVRSVNDTIPKGNGSEMEESLRKWVTHPGAGPTQNVPRFLGFKNGLKLTPVVPEIKAIHEDGNTKS